MPESKAQKRRRNSDREARRIATTKAKHGADFFHRNAKIAGKQTPTKFNSETASAAANARWEKARRERGTKKHHGKTTKETNQE